MPTPVAPAVASSVPETTERVTVTPAAPASMSPTMRPVLARFRLTCSVAA